MDTPSVPAEESESLQISILKKTFPWENLSYELREMIFVEVHLLDPDTFIHGSESYFKRGLMIPPLVVALWDQPLSYSQVMEWFGKENSHLIYHVLEASDVGIMTKAELEVFHSAEIIFLGENERQAFLAGDEYWHLDSAKTVDSEGLENCPCMAVSRHPRSPKPPASLSRALRLAFNLREINLSLVTENAHDQMHFITEFPFCLEGCKALSKLTVDFRREIDVLGEIMYHRIVGGMVEHLSQKMGVRGQLVRDSSKYGGHYEQGLYYTDNAQSWTWEAWPGQTMDWSRRLGRVWKYPGHLRRGEVLIETESDFNQDWSHEMELLFSAKAKEA